MATGSITYLSGPLYPNTPSLLFCTFVTSGFLQNPDVAGNGGSGGQKRVRPIAIDYRTVAGTAGAECKGDRRSKGPDGWSPEWTLMALRRHKGEET